MINYAAIVGLARMEGGHPSHGAVRFGVFEVDLRAGELRKQGVKIKLQDQPFQILQILLERSGEMVTREELRKRIWPVDTFVDFDQGLNNAIKRLRESLSDSPENPRFIETVPRHGYRFIGNLGTTPGRIKSLAVLPLENLSRDPEQEYFAEGLTEALITTLAKIGELRVVSRTSAMQYRGVRKSLREIARELEVEAIVEGTVLRVGDRVRITAQLIDAAKETHLWAESYERDTQDILALTSEVAHAIASEIQVKLTPEEQTQLRRTRLVDAEAYESYLKGRYHWNKRTLEGLTKGAEHFQAAIDRDPTYAAAYAGLADSASRLGFWTDTKPEDGCARGKAAALKAIEMDNTLAEAYAALCYASLHYDFNIRVAEEASQRAIELDPHNAFAFQGRACCLMASGRAEDAATEILYAAHLEPLTMVLQWTVGVCLYFARQYDEAIAQSQRVLELDPKFAPFHWTLGLAFIQKRKYEQAVDEMEEAVQTSRRAPFYLGFLGHIYGATGRREDALNVISELEELSKQRHVSPYWAALIYTALCEKDSAFLCLECAYRERAPWMAYLKPPPWFDNLRSDSRYYRLLQRMSIPI